jgi:hypothetical protein
MWEDAVRYQKREEGTLMKKLRLVAPVGLLVLASACNGSDGGGLTDDQQAAVDQLLQIEEEEGIAFDRECIEDKAAELSDDDAAAIAAAGPDGDVELSEAGQLLTLELYNCIDNDAMVELLIQELGAAGDDVDEDCVRDALDGVDIGALFAASEGGGDIQADPEAAAAMLSVMDCIADPGS